MPNCWIVERQEDKSTSCHWSTCNADDIDSPVQVAVAHSAVNYKDALAVTGKGRIIRRFPCTPGIDLAGTVVRSDDARWQVGDRVFATGWGLGEVHSGGLTQLAGVEGDWLLPIPAGWDSASIMSLGTAGLTAMQAVIGLERNLVTPGNGPIAVTGATGGVAMVAIHLLAALGYEVHAVTGKKDDPEAAAQLEALGATELLDRTAFAGEQAALGSERYAGGVDTTGSTPLAALLARTKRYGAVATCGVAAGSDLPTTMFPFILRGVSLVGVSSVEYPTDRRQAAWKRLTDSIDPDSFAPWTRQLPLTEVPDAAAEMIAGTTRGRIVVDCR